MEAAIAITLRTVSAVHSASKTGDIEGGDNGVPGPVEGGEYMCAR